jgi:unsaturated rhamnogalacturonyl hydrolase
MQIDLSAPHNALVDQAWSRRMADSAIARYTPDVARWHYEHGLLLKAIEQVWRATGEDKYWRFIQNTIDLFVDEAGGIRTYRTDEYNLDQINPGKVLFPIWHETGDPRYAIALKTLRQQLIDQPRTHSGGFWHKQIYPYQMWLDGIYMASPFLAEYAALFDEPAAFDDVAQQIILLEQQARDPQTGLLYHAWDESKQQRWADPVTGCSPYFWGRALGWYAMALVDVLDYLPVNHRGRPRILAILIRLIEAVLKVQGRDSGLWYQVLDQGERAGNYLEASASCMFVYAIAKAVRKGYLPIADLLSAQRGYQGIVTRFLTVADRGEVNLAGTCSVAGLGGDPYRDGSYDYYISEPIVTNDYKGVGAFILAAVEIEAALKDQLAR